MVYGRMSGFGKALKIKMADKCAPVNDLPKTSSCGGIGSLGFVVFVVASFDGLRSGRLLVVLNIGLTL